MFLGRNAAGAGDGKRRIIDYRREGIADVQCGWNSRRRDVYSTTFLFVADITADVGY